MQGDYVSPSPQNPSFSSDQNQKIRLVMDMGCPTREQAIACLQINSWNVDASIDLFLSQSQSYSSGQRLIPSTQAVPHYPSSAPHSSPHDPVEAGRSIAANCIFTCSPISILSVAVLVEQPTAFAKVVETSQSGSLASSSSQLNVIPNTSSSAAPSLGQAVSTGIRPLQPTVLPPSNSSALSIPMIDEEGTRQYLTSQGWPMGLQKLLTTSVLKTPYKFFICDDSGSMLSNDGHRLYSGNKLVSCTRWAELTEALKFHATLAHLIGSPTQFRLLNSSQPIVIGDRNYPDNLSIFLSLLDGSPSGGTPLCRHVGEVIYQIQQVQQSLRSAGQRAVVVIATDGESSDGDLASAMAPLKDLPVNVVVRLCTDDERTVKYWNEIDKQLELELDVLDDHVGEGEEVHESNPWLTYAEPLHRAREFGVPFKEFDLLDEERLSPEHLRSVCSVLFDIPIGSIPHPEANFKPFLATITRANAQLATVWSPSAKGLRPWVEINEVKRLYGPKGGCSVM